MSVPAFAIAAGCSSQADTFAITFINDTGQNLVLNLCSDDACTSYEYSDKVPAVCSLTENIATDNVFTR